MIAKSAFFQLAKALDGLPVLGCLPGTPAALAGVRYGDIVLWVNGQRTRTLVEYVVAKGLQTDGMNLVIFRSGEEFPVEFKYREGPPSVDVAELLTDLVSMRPLSADVEGDSSVS